MNNDKLIDGFIVQLPLPNHIDEQKILMAIDPNKDVDGFHPTNFGKMALNMKTFIPATPFGIMELLKRYNIETSGKNTVVIGRSHIVGRPISILMNSKGIAGDSTVTVVHSRTKNLEHYTKNADIIISALGIPEFVKENMVKDGVVIIDVGITRVKDDSKEKGYVIKGDVDFDSVGKKASYITPVPGGVGPMTISIEIVVGFTVIIPLSSTVPFTWEPLKSIKRIPSPADCTSIVGGICSSKEISPITGIEIASQLGSKFQVPVANSVQFGG